MACSLQSLAQWHIGRGTSFEGIGIGAVAPSLTIKCQGNKNCSKHLFKQPVIWNSYGKIKVAAKAVLVKPGSAAFTDTTSIVSDPKGEGFHGGWEDTQAEEWTHKPLSGGPGGGKRQENEDEDDKSAFEATLDMLEWGRLCEHVGTFASTSMGRKMAGALTFPPTQEGSEALLAETKAALAIESVLGGTLDFGGINTGPVNEGLGMLSKGIPIGAPQAAALALLLMGANGLRRSILGAVTDGSEEEKAELLPLAEMVVPMVTHPELVRAIWEVVDEDGSVREGASPDLRRARVQHRTLLLRLQDLLARFVKERPDGGSGGEVTAVGGRLCVVVPAEGKASAPGLLLQSSAGGASLYVEPVAAVPLNNKLAEAWQEVARAEQAVLTALSARLRDHLDDFKFVRDVVVRLDVIAARARFGSWIGANPPSFLPVEAPPCPASWGAKGRPGGLEPGNVRSAGDAGGTMGAGPLVDLQQLRHPLLLLQHRERLRQAKRKAAATSKTAKRLTTKHGAWTSGALAEAEEAAAQAVEEVAVLEASVPVAIDVQVPHCTRVVTITGPNTGGKTAAIKSVGLAALMAKAGLFVQAADAQLPWVDAVLADIGDQQSLAQSLSTFSGHLARVQRIRKESTAYSLVLLDEVGAGTDPIEGAALGMALLEALAERRGGGSLLTLATTHHGELKTLKYRDSRFENASVEFDEERLAPTYRLLWGIPGRSNALNIAERLGMPAGIISEARRIQGSATAEVNEVIMAMEQAKRACVDDLAATELLVREAEKMHKAVSAAARRLDSQERKMKASLAAMVAAAADEAQATLLSGLRGTRAKQRAASNQSTSPVKRAGTLEESAQETAASRIDDRQTERGRGLGGNSQGGSAEEAAASQPVEVVAPTSLTSEAEQRENTGHGAAEGPSSDDEDSWVPSAGELVSVPKLNAQAKVIAVNTSKKTVSVALGLMQMTVKWSEVRRLDSQQTGTLALSSGSASHPQVFNKVEVSRDHGKHSKARKEQSPESVPRGEANLVDIRGLYPDEAQEVLEEQIGFLVESGEQGMYVLHGVGTGRLRAATELFLMEDSRVCRVERASSKDGGEGTTIAVFR